MKITNRQFDRGRFMNEFKTMIREKPQDLKKQRDLVIGEAFEIDFFYETLASLKADLTFKVFFRFLIF
jgi:hypothetical protein